MKSIWFAFSLLTISLIALTGCKKESQNPPSNSGGGGNNTVECDSIVTDINGNVYSVVAIGSQCWMQENLKTLHYNDGEVILHIMDNNAWINSTDGAWCFFQNNDAFGPTYGLLYNWYAVNTGKLCPEGWHIPTAEEWETLWEYVDYDGGALKAVSTWTAPNVGASNSSGFTALPGGSRVGGGAFVGIVGSAYFYSSTPSQSGNVYSRSLFYNDANMYLNDQPKAFGYSCRCIKDVENESSNNPGYNCNNGSCEAVSDDAQYATLSGCQTACENNTDPCNLTVSISSAGNSATAVASNGNPPYNYEWSNGATGPTVSGLAPGNYTVTASEVSNPACTANASVTITDSSSNNCCDCTGLGFDCEECCDGKFDMLGESWATWEAIFSGSGCDCN